MTIGRMRVLVVMAVLAALAGCEPAPTELQRDAESPAIAQAAPPIDRSTPQAVVEAFLLHMVANDWLAMLECIDPSQRADYEAFLAFHKATVDKIYRNAALARTEMSADDGELVLLGGRHRFWNYGSLFPLPVAPLTLTPQWELIEITLLGQVAEMRVDDALAAVLVLEEGQWYLSGVEYTGELRDKGQWVLTPGAGMARWLIDTELDGMYDRILGGTITRQELLDNCEPEFLPAWEQRNATPDGQATENPEIKDDE
jgi:hypothetical protein